MAKIKPVDMECYLAMMLIGRDAMHKVDSSVLIEVRSAEGTEREEADQLLVRKDLNEPVVLNDTMFYKLKEM